MQDQILEFLGRVVAYGGGSAAVAYLLFTYFGKGWIENKFLERLEQFKHLQTIEIQRLRVEIDSTLNGILRLQEKEFETLPEAWGRLDEAFSRVRSLVSPLQQYPDLDRMTPEELEEFLSGSELLNTQKQEVRGARKKVEKYSDIIFWNRLHKVRVSCSDLDVYVVRYGIFFPPNIKDLFDKIVEELRSVVTQKEIGKEGGDLKFQHESWNKTKNSIEPLFQEIEREIHERLRSHGARR